MITRSGTRAQRRREAANGTVKLLEQRTEALEAKEWLMDDDKRSALRMSKLLGDVSADFKNYHFAIVDTLENEDDVKAEQEVLDHHELSVLELVDRLGMLVEVPLKTKPTTESGPLRKRIAE